MKVRKIEEKVAEYAKVHDLCASGERVIVTLSGGADSVALLRILHSIGVECSALHCNFHLRGDESDRDEAFVRDLCSKLGIPLKVKHFDVGAYEREHKVSTEMACRELRYAWFDEECISQCAVAIAVAHHHDDSVETFFLNLLRGTGIQGLTGIRVKNGKVVRPLLCLTRAEIEDYLHELGQTYVVDSTNLENDFKRNKIRNVLIPTLNELFPDYTVGMERTLQNMQGCNDLYQHSVAVMRENMVTITQDGLVKIDLSSQHDYEGGATTAVYELIKDFGFKSHDAEMICKCVVKDSNETHTFFSAKYSANLKGKILEIYLRQDSDFEQRLNLNDLLKSRDRIQGFSASIEQKKKGSKRIEGIDGKSSIALNVKILEECPEVVIRGWKMGDTISPYGMNGTKLVSDIFTENKYSAFQKNNALLLATATSDTILWAVNLRASRHYAVTADDEMYLKLEYSC